MSSEDESDLIFKALGHRVRRRMLDLLKDEPLTTGMLCARFPELDRCTVMQHLGVLEGAGLVVAERRGGCRTASGRTPRGRCDEGGAGGEVVGRGSLEEGGGGRGLRPSHQRGA